MNPEDVHHLRDRLLLLAECSNTHKLPQNVKRKTKPVNISPKARLKSGPKWSMQDFVRRDPSYTPDIEHLVFPARKTQPQQVSANPATSKTRSRLAEMFALSRHLQQRSTERDVKARSAAIINRSIDSALGPNRGSSSGNLIEPRTAETVRRWMTVEEPVRQLTSTCMLSPSTEPDMATARGPNISSLHLRGTSKHWDISPTSGFQSGHNSRPCANSRGNSGVLPLTKHQSIGGAGYKWEKTSSFYAEGQVISGDLFASGTCSRELSPVRWCDHEVDGVYLGRSGWVQVQQRSLDESRRITYGNAITSSLESSRRTGIKLANYHCNSEPARKAREPQRPIYLPLNTRDTQLECKSPSPPLSMRESPPSVTPIISPPPAFQDRKTHSTKSRSFFGKPPFLPRSNAIVDSDVISPPPSPPLEKIPNKNATLPQVSQSRKVKLTPSPVSRPPISYRMPQAKSLEDTTTRRTQFLQRHAESSSSSSSSMGFRSLDSCVNRPVMPRLSENTDSSIDVYDDADEEDNNSSSVNIRVPPTSVQNPPNDSNRSREKISPSGRSTRHSQHRSQIRRSPASSDSNKQANCSSHSSSSDEFPVRSPSGSLQQLRRSGPVRQYFPSKDDAISQKVRRSRSLQLPDKKLPAMQTRVSPQNAEPQHRNAVKVGSTTERSNPRRHIIQPPSKVHPSENDILREAEIVTEFLYGSRSRAAAQALIAQRYNNTRDEKGKAPSANNGYDVYFVGNAAKDKQKVLQRGVSTPNTAISSKQPFKISPTETTNPCNSSTCDFWPHCAHRESINNRMKLSQSYPTHQRSVDVSNGHEGHYRRRSPNSRDTSDSRNSHRVHTRERRLSPSNKRDVSAERKVSPLNSKSASRSPSAMGNSSNSSSSSDVWVTTSDRTISKSPRNPKSSGASTPLDEVPINACDITITRPGSAPMDDNTSSLESQQRSLSLPKSFLSVNYQQGCSSDL